MGGKARYSEITATVEALDRWLMRPVAVTLYWLSCQTTCIAHSVTSPKTKLARF